MLSRETIIGNGTTLEGLRRFLELARVRAGKEWGRWVQRTTPRLRSVLVAIALFSLGFAFVQVTLLSPRRGLFLGLLRFPFLVAVPAVPLGTLAVVLPKLEGRVKDLRRALKGRLNERQRIRARRRAEHRVAMKHLVIDYAAREQSSSTRGRQGRQR